MASTKPEQDIAQLEALLRQLEKEYDQFFSGVLRREPAVTENNVLSIIRAYVNRPIQNSGVAFKYAALVARYNSFKTVWTRRMREREEGRGPAAAAVHRGPAAGPAERTLAPVAVPMPEFLTTNPLREQRHLKQFFETYRRMRQECGESTAKLQAESFQKALAEKIEKIKREQRCDSVLVRVVSEQGKTRLVAKPFRRSREGGADGAS